MNKTLAALFVVAAFAASASRAQDVVTPPPALVLDGVPPISTELARKLQPYGEFRPHGLLSWHPTKREMLVRRRLTTTNQVHLVAAPGAAPIPLTDQADAVNNAEYEPTRDRKSVV